MGSLQRILTAGSVVVVWRFKPFLPSWQSRLSKREGTLRRSPYSASSGGLKSNSIQWVIWTKERMSDLRRSKVDDDVAGRGRIAGERWKG